MRYRTSTASARERGNGVCGKPPVPVMPPAVPIPGNPQFTG